MEKNPKIKQEKSAGAIIYYYDKEPFFLLLKYPSYWGFAKGIIEEGENIIETVKREVKEETGLENVELIEGFKHVQNWFYKFHGNLISKEAIFFLGKVKKEDKEKVKISFEHEDYKWLSYDEAMKKIKIKSNREMLEKAYKFINEYEKQKRLF